MSRETESTPLISSPSGTCTQTSTSSLISDDRNVYTDTDKGLLVNNKVNIILSSKSNHSQPQTQPHKATIGMLGSLAIMINSLTGPAMLNLPATYQQSGFIPTTFVILVVCYISIYCSRNMINLVTKIPGNRNFGKEVEYSECYRELWSFSAYIITQICFFGCVTCQNIASIVDTSQVVDEFLANFMGESIAIAIKLSTFSSFFHHNNTINGGIKIVKWSKKICHLKDPTILPCDPFNDQGDETLVITIGYIFSAVCFIPLCYMDLKENTATQIFSFLVLLGVCAQFIFFFVAQEGLNFENLSLWGGSWDTLFGIVLFNYSIVTAIPAWLFEKSPSISANQVIDYSTWSSTYLYILFGSLGALALPNVSQNMLSTMITGSFGVTIQIGASFFAFVIIGFGIPLFSVLTRLNLAGSGLFSVRKSNDLAVIFPWGVSWIFYKSSATAQLLSWGGMVFTSVIAFLAPLLLALHTVKKKGYNQVWPICYLSQTLSDLDDPQNNNDQQKRDKKEVIALVLLLGLSALAIIISIGSQFAIPSE